MMYPATIPQAKGAGIWELWGIQAGRERPGWGTFGQTPFGRRSGARAVCSRSIGILRDTSVDLRALRSSVVKIREVARCERKFYNQGYARLPS